MAGDPAAPAAPGGPEITRQRPADAPPRKGIEIVDESLGDPADPEFEPFGSGVESTTSQQSPQVVLDLTPDRDRTLVLDEVAVSTESNGQVEVTLNGQSFGSYTGGTDVTIPFAGAVMPFTGRVRILHESTDGNDVTTKAQVSGRLV